LADPERHRITVCYLRDARDREFAIGERFRGRVDYVEIVERHSLDPRIWRELRALVRHGRFHLVHAHEYKTDLLAFLLAWTEGIVPLATAHGWVGRSARERAYYAADRRLLARFPAVIAVSSDVRDALLRA